MKTIIRLGWLAPMLVLGIELRAAAQDTSVISGKVLILANDRVLEGDIERVGDQYRIRRGMSETLLAVSRTKRLCADWDETLAYMRRQANLGDPDERLRLARWCQQHDLKEHALVEARAALEMRPTHPETKQLLHVLQRTTASAGAAPQPTVVKALDAVPQLDLSADSLASFTAKVQPILMNTCASCHAHGQGGAFHLQHAADGAARAATQRNLAAVIPYLNFEHPAASQFLVKAVNAHGTSRQPPLRDRQTIPFQSLLHWTEQVAAGNPHLRKPGTAAAPVRSSPETAVAALPASAAPQSQVVSRSVTRIEVYDLPNPSSQAKPALVAPNDQPLPPATPTPARAETAPTPNAADPFDPAAFNRQAAAPK